MTRILMTVLIAAMPFAAMTSVRAAEPPATQSVEVKKELQKLMNAFGAGEMSARDYKERKEALLKSASTRQVGSN